MKRGLIFTLLLCAVIHFTGCMQQSPFVFGEDIEPSEAQSVEQTNPQLYRFNTGDVIRVLVYGENDLSAEYRINGDGAISFPLIGNIKLAGLNVYEAEQLIKTELMDGYLRQPSISIEVTQYRPYSILGEVNNAGNYSFSEGLSVADAIASAGGFTYRANRREFEILRRTNEGWERSFTNVSDFIYPGDVIYVGER